MAEYNSLKIGLSSNGTAVTCLTYIVQVQIFSLITV